MPKIPQYAQGQLESSAVGTPQVDNSGLILGAQNERNIDQQANFELQGVNKERQVADQNIGLQRAEQLSAFHGIGAELTQHLAEHKFEMAQAQAEQARLAAEQQKTQDGIIAQSKLTAAGSLVDNIMMGIKANPPKDASQIPKLIDGKIDDVIKQGLALGDMSERAAAEFQKGMLEKKLAYHKEANSMVLTQGKADAETAFLGSMDALKYQAGQGYDGFIKAATALYSDVNQKNAFLVWGKQGSAEMHKAHQDLGRNLLATVADQHPEQFPAIAAKLGQLLPPTEMEKFAKDARTSLQTREKTEEIAVKAAAFPVRMQLDTLKAQVMQTDNPDAIKAYKSQLQETIGVLMKQPPNKVNDFLLSHATSILGEVTSHQEKVINEPIRQERALKAAERSAAAAERSAAAEERRQKAEDIKNAKTTPEGRAAILDARSAFKYLSSDYKLMQNPNAEMNAIHSAYEKINYAQDKKYIDEGAASEMKSYLNARAMRVQRNLSDGSFDKSKYVRGLKDNGIINNIMGIKSPDEIYYEYTTKGASPAAHKKFNPTGEPMAEIKIDSIRNQIIRDTANKYMTKYPGQKPPEDKLRQWSNAAEAAIPLHMKD